MTVEGGIALIAARSGPQYSASVPQAIGLPLSYETVWHTWQPSPRISHELKVQVIIRRAAAYNIFFMADFSVITSKVNN